ncbi:unnamed protein product [Umbelopsis vinacea]
MTSWTKLHHSRKPSRPRSIYTTSRHSVANFCTNNIASSLAARPQHRVTDTTAQSLFRAAGGSWRRFRSSQAAKVTSVQLEGEETLHTRQKKEASNSTHGSVFLRNINDRGHPPQSGTATQLFHHWRQYRYNAPEDFEEMLEALRKDGSKLTAVQQFKIMRSALYQIPEQSCQLSWKLYQDLIDHGLECFMESNNYSRLLNNLKYGRASETVEQMLTVLTRMQKVDPTMPCVYHYSQILFALSRHGQVDKVRDLMLDMHEKHLALSSSHYTSLAVACLNADPQAYSIDDILADFIQAVTADRIIPERQACNIIVELLSRSCDLPRAIKFLQTMENAALKAGSQTAEALIYTHPDVFTYTSLISGFCRMGDLSAAKRVLIDMNQAQVAPNFVTYAIMVNACLHNRRSKDALHFIEQMRYLQSTAKHPVYMALMVKALALDMRKVAEILYNALNIEISGNWDVLDNMQRSAYVLMKVANGDTWEVQRRFRRYIRHQPELLNSVMINHLIRGLGAKGNLRGVNEAFSWLNSTKNSNTSHLQPTRYTYHHYIQALFNCHQTEKAFDAVADMKARGFGMDALTYAIVIKGLVANKELEMAWKVFEMMKQDRASLVGQGQNTGDAHDSPFLRAMASIMSGLVDLDLGKQNDMLNEHTGNTTLLADTFSELKALDSLPVTSNTSKGSSPKSKLGIQRAFAMFRDLQSSKFDQASVYTYTIIIAGFAKYDVQRAMQIYQHMLSDGIQPNDVVYTALIQGFAIARDAKGALEVFEDMRQRDIEPNQFTWHYLLRAMLRSGVDKEYIDQVGNASRNGLPYKRHKYRTKRWELLAYVK